jgi:hypothetical protein
MYTIEEAGTNVKGSFKVLNISATDLVVTSTNDSLLVVVGSKPKQAFNMLEDNYLSLLR